MNEDDLFIMKYILLTALILGGSIAVSVNNAFKAISKTPAKSLSVYTFVQLAYLQQG